MEMIKILISIFLPMFLIDRIIKSLMKKYDKFLKLISRQKLYLGIILFIVLSILFIALLFNCDNKMINWILIILFSTSVDIVGELIIYLKGIKVVKE